MLPNDILAVGPFIAAVGVALAVLVVDLVVPGRRGPVLVTGLGGEVNTAAQAVHEALAVSRQLGRTHDAADWLTAFAFVYRMAGDTERSTVAAQDAVRTWHELGNLGRLPVLFKALASLALAQGRLERAVRLGEPSAAPRKTSKVRVNCSPFFAAASSTWENSAPARR